MNYSLCDVVKADILDLLYGKDYITEEILVLNLKFHHSQLDLNNLTEKPYLIVLDSPREGAT